MLTPTLIFPLPVDDTPKVVRRRGRSRSSIWREPTGLGGPYESICRSARTLHTLGTGVLPGIWLLPTSRLGVSVWTQGKSWSDFEERRPVSDFTGCDPKGRKGWGNVLRDPSCHWTIKSTCPQERSPRRRPLEWTLWLSLSDWFLDTLYVWRDVDFSFPVRYAHLDPSGVQYEITHFHSTLDYSLDFMINSFSFMTHYDNLSILHVWGRVLDGDTWGRDPRRGGQVTGWTEDTKGRYSFGRRLIPLETRVSSWFFQGTFYLVIKNTWYIDTTTRISHTERTNGRYLGSPYKNRLPTLNCYQGGGLVRGSDQTSSTIPSSTVWPRPLTPRKIFLPTSSEDGLSPVDLL